jgi:uncharacterized protein involved in type VI secretion and phage assembly
MDRLTEIPSLDIEVDGLALAADETRGLGEVRVQQKLSRPTLGELRFFQAADIKLPTEKLQPGAAIRVTLRALNQLLFQGEITAVELVHEASRGTELRVRAFDALHRLRKRQPVRSFRGVTVPDLARELVVEDGITVEFDVSGPMWETVMQFRQTDFDLLADLGAKSGLHFQLWENVLRILDLTGTGEPRDLELGDNLLEVRVERNGDPACRSVKAQGWDPWRVEERAGESGQSPNVRRFGVEVAPESMNSSGEWQLTDEVAQQDDQLQAMATAELENRVAAEVVLNGTADGNADLHPGSIVELLGVDEAISGQYVLTEVTHIIDARRGFVSEISSRPPKLEHRPWSAMTSFGQVSSLDDPDRLGRVRVTLPTYQGIETDWLSVVCPGAGKDKGLAAFPDVGDRVLVLFPRQDLAQGIVLGGLYGTEALPDGVVDGGAVQKFAFRTAGGQFVRLDDANQTARVENSDGSFIELSPKKVTLHARVALDIEAPGSPITITGKSVDFRRG